MARSKGRSQIVLDWFTVSYRTVWSVLVGVVVVACVGGYFFFYSQSSIRAEAAEALSRASDRIRETASAPAEPKMDEARAAARAALDEGRNHFDGERFEDALRSAIHAENLAQKAIDLVKGEEGARAVRFYRLEGDVRVKRAGEFSWEAATLKTTLGLGDQVKTSASASAQIIYFDGTVTTLKPASLLEVRQVHEDPATRVKKVSEKLNWGEVVASSQKKNVDGSVHEVSTDSVTARVTEPGEVRIAVDKESGKASLDVFQGRVEVASQGRRESVEAGERIHAAADGTLSGKERLPIAPRLVAPSDQRVFVYEDPGKETTTLTWERIPDASRYHLVISDRVLFTDPLYDDEDRKDTSVLIEGINPADYYWKVAAISPKGITGPFSQVRRFRVTSQRVRDKTDKTPPPLEITEFVQTGTVVIINGKTEPGALLWVDNEKIEVHEDGTFYAVVKLRKEGENLLQFLAQDASGNTAQANRNAYVEAF